MRKVLGLFAGIIFVLMANTAVAENVKARLVLDNGPWGVHAWIIQGIKNGAFAERGLDIEYIGNGPGSVKSGMLISSGKAEIGFQDYSGVVLVNSKTDDPKLLTVFVVDDKAQDGVYSFKEKGIASFDDLDGKKLGGYATGVTTNVLPAITSAKWDMINIPFSGRVPALVSGEVDAVEGFLTTNILNFEKVGVTPDKLNILKLSDKFPMAVSRVITVNSDWAAANPEAVKALREVCRELVAEFIKNPKAGVDAIDGPFVSTDAKRAVELKRAIFANDELVNTPFVQKHGISNASALEPRLTEYTSLLVSKLGLPNRHPDNKYFDLD